MNNYKEYYPRPLLKRDSFFSLCGTWKLNGNDIEIPFPPESDLSGYKGDLNTLEYTRAFSLPDSFQRENEKLLLNFGAVMKVDIFLSVSISLMRSEKTTFLE